MPDKNPPSLAHDAANRIISSTHTAVDQVNAFTSKIFHTRGGRIGSGMGSVIEALWGFHLNAVFAKDKSIPCELGWIYGHEYNDFACILTDEDWDPETQRGELLRVEVKSMIASADESKAHFDRLQHEFAENEILAVFLWDWTEITVGSRTVYPKIVDYFVGFAAPIAKLRDVLHVERGGSFVTLGNCPDCTLKSCPHVGEPLNASNKRERKSGPEAFRVSSKTSHANNFGGLLRMLGSKGICGKALIKNEYETDPTTARFIDFMARNLPKVAKTIQ